METIDVLAAIRPRARSGLAIRRFVAILAMGWTASAGTGGDGRAFVVGSIHVLVAWLLARGVGHACAAAGGYLSIVAITGFVVALASTLLDASADDVPTLATLGRLGLRPGLLDRLAVSAHGSVVTVVATIGGASAVLPRDVAGVPAECVATAMTVAMAVAMAALRGRRSSTAVVARWIGWALVAASAAPTWAARAASFGTADPRLAIAASAVLGLVAPFAVGHGRWTEWRLAEAARLLARRDGTTLEIAIAAAIGAVVAGWAVLRGVPACNAPTFVGAAIGVAIVRGARRAASQDDPALSSQLGRAEPVDWLLARSIASASLAAAALVGVLPLMATAPFVADAAFGVAAGILSLIAFTFAAHALEFVRRHEDRRIPAWASKTKIGVGYVVGLFAVRAAGLGANAALTFVALVVLAGVLTALAAQTIGAARRARDGIGRARDVWPALVAVGKLLFAVSFAVAVTGGRPAEIQSTAGTLASVLALLVIAPRAPEAPPSLRWLPRGASFWCLGVAWSLAGALAGRLVASNVAGASPHARAVIPDALAVCVAPLVEEVVFRGYLQTSLERWLPRRWRVACVPIAAILFAAVHGVQSITPVIFLLGIACGLTLRTTRSLGAAVAVHAAYNAALLLG